MSQEIWIAVVGFLFSTIQALIAVVVSCQIFEIRKFNKSINEITIEITKIRASLWTNEQIRTLVQIELNNHYFNCEKCSGDCANFKSYRQFLKEKKDKEKE